MKRLNKLMHKMGELMGSMSSAMQADMADLSAELQPGAAAVSPDVLKECLVLTLTPVAINRAIKQSVQKSSPEREIVKIHYVMTPGAGLEAKVYYRVKQPETASGRS